MHSYTAQYSLIASGKLLPCVFLCMKESSGKFGLTVSKKVDYLMREYENAYVTCSKSGKVSKVIYTEFLRKCVSPYVEQKNFLLLIDSWGGQTDATLYDDIFENERGKVSCTIKVTPPPNVHLSVTHATFIFFVKLKFSLNVYKMHSLY